MRSLVLGGLERQELKDELTEQMRAPLGGRTNAARSNVSGRIPLPGGVPDRSPRYRPLQLTNADRRTLLETFRTLAHGWSVNADPKVQRLPAEKRNAGYDLPHSGRPRRAGPSS